MAFVWMLAGAIFGLIVGGLSGGDGAALAGFLFGAVVGLLWARLGALVAMRCSVRKHNWQTCGRRARKPISLPRRGRR